MFRTRSSDLAQAFFRPSQRRSQYRTRTPDVAAPSGAAFCLPAGGALGASVESAGMQAVSGNDRPQVAWDDDGLVPCIAQDWATGEVLTLAYMNREALDRTLDTGELHFWSRSRRELWHKGETSGNVQRLRSLRYDCDADALLALVDPAGPACHTGERTCFYRSIGTDEVASHEALPALARTLAARHREMPDGSYTAELFRAGPERMGAKVEEEAEEVARAGREESDERLREE